jgi:membrane protease YdiL (CAAX protease family)
MILKKYRHPILFYSLAVGIPWAFWFMAAYLSHRTPGSQFDLTLASILGILGLMSPMIVAFSLIFPDKELREDFLGRFFHFKGIKAGYLFTACFLMPASILLAQSISLLFGYSADQFNFSGSFSFSAGIYPAWFILILAPVLEELAWHTYGTDCLRARFKLCSVSILFGVIWVAWHIPLSFIKDYYQSNLVASGWLYTVNYAVSIIPFVILMNWLYYKTKRNILVAIIFHITANLFNEIFMTDPDSKVIQTLLLLGLTIFLLIKERDFFFKSDEEEEGTTQFRITG